MNFGCFGLSAAFHAIRRRISPTSVNGYLFSLGDLGERQFLNVSVGAWVQKGERRVPAEFGQDGAEGFTPDGDLLGFDDIYRVHLRAIRWIPDGTSSVRKGPLWG